MRLYLSFTSPYARKVRACLLEKSLPFEAIDVATSTEQAGDHNPLGKVPTLVLENGTVLFDSSVIVEALDGLYPAPRLIPEEPTARALVRRWEAVGDGICDVLVPAVLERRRPAERQDLAYAARLEAKARRSLEFLEANVRGKRTLEGEAFSLADIAVVCAVGYVNLRQPALLENLPALSEYVRVQLERPSLASTLPPNLPVRG